MDELAKPWLVVRNGQIIHADDRQNCAFAVAREAEAIVYWCNGVIDGVPRLVQMAEVAEFEGAPEDYQGEDSDSCLGSE